MIANSYKLKSFYHLHKWERKKNTLSRIVFAPINTYSPSFFAKRLDNESSRAFFPCVHIPKAFNLYFKTVDSGFSPLASVTMKFLKSNMLEHELWVLAVENWSHFICGFMPAFSFISTYILWNQDKNARESYV